MQAVLAGRVPSTTPQQRAHPDFPLRAFIRCDSCGRGLTGSREVSAPSSEVSFRKGAAGTGFKIAFEADSAFLVSKL